LEPAGVADSKWRVEATTWPSLRLPRIGDERLARLAARGNSRAFAAVYERYHQPLYRYCRSILRDDTDAQDALQSTFTRALAALQRGQRSAPLRPWLFRIAHNEAISSLRRRRRGEVGLTDAALPIVPSAEDQAGDRARLSLLMGDLAALPDRARSALVMRELSGLSHEDIALALGTSPGAAKQAIFEARRALTECAEGRAMDCAEVCRAMSDGDRRVLRGRKVRAHLRDCEACAAFASSIEARQSELRALVPVLPAAVSAAVLSRAMEAGIGGAGAVAGGAAGSGGGAAAGAAGKTIGVAFGTKGLATASLLATAAVSVGGVAAVVRLAPHPGRALHARPAPAAHAGPARHTGARAARASTPGLGSVRRSPHTGAAAVRSSTHGGAAAVRSRIHSGAAALRSRIHAGAAASRRVRFIPSRSHDRPVRWHRATVARGPHGHGRIGWGHRGALEGYTGERVRPSKGTRFFEPARHELGRREEPDVRRSRALTR
jgi:RNA polymerase sigma factor (sigma-70 family)